MGESAPKRAQQKFAGLRERHPWLDHVVRTQQHYSAVFGSQQAGAVTYFGFLSFFPVLALAFFVVGIASQIYPDANEALTNAISSVFPGIIGEGSGQIALDDIRRFSGVAGVVGLLGVLYSGLNWLSALRDALYVVFETPRRDVANFIKGKARDLLTLAIVGLVLVVSVAVAGLVAGFSADVLDWLGLGRELSWLVKLIALVLGLLANMVLFFAMFKLLAEPRATKRSLWSGAFLGAVGFEILKQLSSVLLASTKGQPAFQAFGIALILLVWINYFSRLVLYAAAWAHTAADSRALRAESTEAATPKDDVAQKDDVAPAAPVELAKAVAEPATSTPLSQTETPPATLGDMTFTRKHAGILLAVAAWNVLTFGMFAKNLYAAYQGGEDRPTGYWVAHTVLIIVNFAIAGVLASLGWKAWRAVGGDSDESVPVLERGA